MDRRVELAWLLDFYGPLLTEHRREVMRLIYVEDFSLSEVAEQMGVSRQAVHDALRKAEAQLGQYEAELGLLKKYLELREQLAAVRETLSDIREDMTGVELQGRLSSVLQALNRIEWIER